MSFSRFMKTHCRAWPMLGLFLISASRDSSRELRRLRAPQATPESLDYQLADGAEQGDVARVESTLAQYDDSQIDPLKREAFSLAIIEAIDHNQVDTRG
jgi:hypothetical protein